MRDNTLVLRDKPYDTRVTLVVTFEEESARGGLLISIAGSMDERVTPVPVEREVRSL